MEEPKALRTARRAAQLIPKGRSLLLKSVATLFGQRQPFVAEVNGFLLEVDLHDSVSRTAYAFGAFEPSVTAVFCSQLPGGGTVLDVGANFGYFTLLAARGVGPAGRVFALEPDPRNRQRLEANILRNGLSNVAVFEEALLDRNGRVDLHLSAPSEENLGNSTVVGGGHPGRRHVSVPCARLDDLVARVGIERIHLLKMDIEGAELDALEGGGGTLASGKVDAILLELHVGIMGAERARKLCELLLGLGYAVRRIRKGKGSRAPRPAARFEPLDLDAVPAMRNVHLLWTLSH